MRKSKSNSRSSRDFLLDSRDYDLWPIVINMHNETDVTNQNMGKSGRF